MKLNSPSTRRKSSTQTGFSLIEMMIALLIFVIGLLALGALQIKGMGYTRDAAMRSRAIYAARSLAEAIKANPGANYATAGASVPSAIGATCNYALNSEAVTVNGQCACDRKNDDINRALLTMSTLLKPASGDKIVIQRLPSPAGTPRSTQFLTPVSCETYLGTTYRIEIKWSEGGGSALIANDQRLVILAQS